MDQSTAQGLLYLALIGLSYLGNWLWARRQKRKGTEEQTNYVNKLVEELEGKITNLQSQITTLQHENRTHIETAERYRTERDAARTENQELNKTLKGERETFVEVSKRVEEMENQIQTLKAEAAKNAAVKEAAAQIVELIREGFMQLMSEMAAPKPTTLPVATAAPIPGVPTEVPEVKPT